MARVSIIGIQHSYPSAALPALQDVSWSVPSGEMAILCGPAGSGKSTLLRILAGLEQPDAGTVLIDDQDVTRIPAADRDVVLAMESYALYPHLSVSENLGFVLRLAGTEPEEIDRRVTRAAEQLALQAVLDEAPASLSSAQRHRVALGRALVRRPRVLLLDEPLAQLSPEDRDAVRDQIGRLQAELGITAIYATSSPDDAAALGGTIAFLDRGVLSSGRTTP